MKLHEVADGRPLIWRLVARQLALGKKVLFHAHLPNSSSYIVGRVLDVGEHTFVLKRARAAVGLSSLTFLFTAADDENLTMRPSLGDQVDYTIEDVK